MILLGTSGWYYNHWIGNFYPPELERSRWLEFYSRHFSTVEINSTFYRFPFRNILKGWYNKTPDGFIFSLKANRLITHVRKLRDVKELLESFYGLADILREKLGPILFQFPPSLKKDANLLSEFLEILPEGYKNVIEFRHKSWYCREVYNIMRKHNTGYCIVSAPRLPCEIEVTADVAYIRWHGIKSWYSYNYTSDDIGWWAGEIRKLSERCNHIYGYFNNDYGGYAVKNCMELKGRLRV
ncbi:MAG TPA: DUF72 domain-containing protein [Candidatus Aenigmarchaeota archaeon]|nr:DUF72 domain-containing protein [Candidatus Aenigmarchaeota archaeon]